MLTVYFLTIIILIFFSAFFSGSESAYAAASDIKLRHRAEETGKKKDKYALALKEDYTSALIAILLGNNLVNIASSSVATLIVLELLGDGYAYIATIVMTVLLLIFGETTPKMIATSNPERASGFLSLPLKWICTLFRPFTKAAGWLVDRIARLWRRNRSDAPAVTEDDLELLIENAEDEGVIDEERSDLLQSALDFDDVLAYEVITPRVDTIALDIDDITEKDIDKVIDSGYSRIPVYQGTIDHMIGILHINSLLRRSLGGSSQVSDLASEIRPLLMPVHYVHRAMPLPDVLAEMKREKSHMVVVTDEYGGTMGVLTMEDVLEQLVGEIWDETDVIENEISKLNDTDYDVDGDMRLDDLFDELGLDDRDTEEFENTTIGGWAIEMLNDYPKEGDSFTWRNLTVTVTKTQNLRVRRLTVHAEPIRDEEDENSEE